MNSFKGKPHQFGMILPILLALFGGGIPILFGADVRLFLLIILIFLGLGIVLLLVRLGVGRKALLFTLGGSLIINPNKFFMTEGLAMTHFGGLPVPFVSLTDLAMTALLWANLSQETTPALRKLTKFVAVALSVWIAAMAVSLVQAAHPGMGFWHMTFEWKCILLFIIIAKGRRQPEENLTRDVVALFCGLATAMLAESAAILLEYSGVAGAGFSFLGIQVGGFRETLGSITANRVGGTYRHPNYLAIPMAALLIPFVAMTLRSNGVLRMLFGVATACAFLNLLLTLSRAGWLAATVASLIFLSILVTTREGRSFLRRTNRTIGIIAFIGLLSVGLMSHTIMRKILESPDTNISGRIVLNEMALEMIRDHPLTGVGLNNSVAASNDYDLMEQFVVHSGIPPVIHNIYLLIGAETGLPGLLAFATLVLFMLISALTQARRRMDHGGDRAFFLAALVAGGFAYLVADMFGPGLRKLEIAYLFWGHLGMVAMLADTSVTPQDGQPGVTCDVA